MNLFFRTGIFFDLEEIIKHLNLFVFTRESVQQSRFFGGWSVQSSNGSYKDGWQQGHLSRKEKTEDEAKKYLEEIGLLGRVFDKPTEICHGYFEYMINSLQASKLAVLRGRIIRLSAGGESVWHRDSPDSRPMFRLHIPIITNEKCFFLRDNEQVHLPATGECYILRVNCMHKVINHGSTDRFHFVADVWPDGYVRDQLV